ncbi:hypothetical protein [Secundilactobacillus malefermentans]|nr:hypothetical protein [Secundilactobacillus malefermentans]KRM56315.1 hypothetical protein FD44_GL001744 [Secundilactobacillus malefermentans DSM 5705 = KCTC 3548]QEA30772.1 hypothetical protein FGL90_00450 [Secundilactobacillus malefermentans]
MPKKTSEAQLKATRTYDQKNPEQRKHRNYKSNAKHFIRNYATDEELSELTELIEAKQANRGNNTGETN